MKIRGSCACGNCSYVIDDDKGIDIANCFCRMCRKATGGTYVTWATVNRSLFHWTGKRPKVYKSSRHGRRYFCGACGAQLALFTTTSADTLDVTVATFTHPEKYPPNRSIWTETGLPWVPENSTLPTEVRESIKNRK
jgi:hypothetical protein